MYYCTSAMSRINRVGRISRIAKQVRARHKLPLTKKRTKGLSALPAARSPRVSSPCVKQPPAIPSPFSPLFAVCCIFSPFRESNRVVDCSAAKGKANEKMETRGAGVRRLRVEKNSHHRKSTLVSRNGETETPRRLSARSRMSPSLLLSSLPSLFAARPSTPFFEYEEQEEAESGRRNEDGKGTSANEAERVRVEGCAKEGQ